jgi:5'-nucleotidase
MALSLSRKEVSDFRFAARFATQLARLVVSKSLMAPFTMLNVNIPAIGQQHIQGIRITSQAHSRFVEEFELTRKKGAKTQYMLKGEMVLIESTGSSDEEALKENYISITPLKLDLTDQASFLKMKDLARKIKI